MKSLYWFFFTDVMLSTQNSVKISDVIAINGTPIGVANFTNQSVVMETPDGKIAEMGVASAAAGVLTFSKRWLDTGDTINEVAAYKLDWRAGTYCYITQLAPNVVDKQGDNTFEWENTFNDFIYLGKGLKGPVFADTLARDAAIPSPAVGMQGIYIVSLWVYQDYYPGGWQSQGTTTTPNATNAVAGKSVLGDATQIANGTNTDWSGQPVVVQPSYLKVVHDDLNTYKPRVRLHPDCLYWSSVNVTISSPWASIGGWSPSNGDRILLFWQSAPAENWAYIFNWAAVAMTRATDFDVVSASEVAYGAEFFVTAGTHIGKRYMLTTTWAIILGTTWLTFTQTYPVLVVDIGAIVTCNAGTTCTFWWRTSLAFNTERRDTGSIHDNSTNNTRLTVPSWGTVYKIGWWSGSWQAWIEGIRILKNWSTYCDTYISQLSNTGNTSYSIDTLDIPSPGDYYELQLFNNAGTNQTSPTDAFFYIQKVA